MTVLAKEIEATILEILPGAHVQVHDPDGEHFQAVVVSERFVGMPLVRQHQLVMNALKGHFKEKVHALSLKTFTPDRYPI